MLFVSFSCVTTRYVGIMPPEKYIVKTTSAIVTRLSMKSGCERMNAPMMVIIMEMPVPSTTYISVLRYPCQMVFMEIMVR